MSSSFLDIEAEHSGDEFSNDVPPVDSDSEMEDFIVDDEDSSPNELQQQLDSRMNLDTIEEEIEDAKKIAEKFERQAAENSKKRAFEEESPSGPSPPIPSTSINPRNVSPPPPPKIISSTSKPIGAQVVFMPEKPSFNIVGAATPVLTLAFPVWLGVYSKGSLAEVEMAQAIQYVLNAATTVQQKDGARITVTLWCIGRSVSKRGMSYKEALKCSAVPGKYLAEVFCQDMNAVKKLSDCINDFRTHLRQGENKETGTSFITKLKKKIEMHVTRDRFNLIEPR
tara:strand:- start:1632 stop:2477 length:846 start_codon:yes stop_codon:yes gene_type:complete